jgi:hypothetical protein
MKKKTHWILKIVKSTACIAGAVLAASVFIKLIKPELRLEGKAAITAGNQEND